MPPDADASESAAKAIQQLYPQHIPLTVEDLSHNEQANQLFAQLIQEKHHIEQHQNNFDETKHQIQMLMKDAERATFATGSVTWKKSKDSIGLDSKALLKLHPEMLEQFPQNKAGTRRFQIYTDDWMHHGYISMKYQFSQKAQKTTSDLPTPEGAVDQ